MSSELRVDRIVPVDGVPTGGGGGVVQVAVGRLNAEIVDTTSASFMSSGLIVSMTPKLSTSKFHIHMGGGRLKARSGSGVEIKMYVSINGGSYASAYSGNRGSTFYYTSDGEVQLPVSFVDQLPLLKIYLTLLYIILFKVSSGRLLLLLFNYLGIESIICI